MDDGVDRPPGAGPLPRHHHDRRRRARARHDGGLSADRMAGPRGLAHLDHRAVGGRSPCRARRRARCSRRWSTDIDLSHDGLPAHGGRATGTSAACRRGCSASASPASSAYEINVPGRLRPRGVGGDLRARASAYGITPYGTEAMHVLRAEKGYIIVGQETDGTVTPRRSRPRLDRSARRSPISSASARSARPAMSAPDRKQLVGLLTANPAIVLEEGAQIVADPRQPVPMDMLGHVTSSYWSPALGRSIALAHGQGRAQPHRRDAACADARRDDRRDRRATAILRSRGSAPACLMFQPCGKGRSILSLVSARTGSGVELSLLPPRARFVLRCRAGAVAAAGQAFGVTLPTDACRAAVSGKPCGVVARTRRMAAARGAGRCGGDHAPALGCARGRAACTRRCQPSRRPPLR